MKKNFVLLCLALMALAGGVTEAASTGTAFTYQGLLNANGTPVNGNLDFQFSLYDAASGGNQVVDLTNLDVAVTNGVFLATLDFGNVFDGNARWLAMGVRTNGNPMGAFTPLTPLQPLQPVPYAIYAPSAGSVVSGAISASQLSTPGGAPAPGQVLSYNGTSLVWSNSATSGSIWSLTGNAGTAPGANFLGTTDNQALELYVNGSRGWQLAPTVDSPNVIGGANVNSVAAGVQGATIGGGGSIATYGLPYPNSVGAYHGTIGGGLGNAIQTAAIESTIAGGNQNTIQNNAHDSIIGGGYQNVIHTNAAYSAIGGGYMNTIQTNANYSSVGGGQGNGIQVGGNNSAIMGGTGNHVMSFDTVIGGGYNNNINSNSAAAFIGGGQLNMVDTNGYNSVIGGGYTNHIQDQFCVIGGGNQNFIAAGSSESTIGGGADNVIGILNGVLVASPYATVGGGYNSQAAGPGSFVGGGGFDGTSFKGNSANGAAAEVGGGIGNVATAAYATVGGGYFNGAGAAGSFVGGGYFNGTGGTGSFVGGGGFDGNNYGGNFAASPASTIAGGLNNSIDSSAAYGTIAGGASNSIETGAGASFIGGGQKNEVDVNSFNSVIGGGYSNYIGSDTGVIGGGSVNYINAFEGVIGGGQSNTVNGNWATVPGGYGNTAGGVGSFAAGVNGTASDPHSFLWCDGSRAGVSQGANSFSVLATGGVWLFSGAYPAGIKLAPGSSSWATLSDRNYKKNIVPVDAQAVLDKLAGVPIARWNYQWEKDSDVPNIGPMAQDFKHAFYPGRDDKSITTLEFDGVELAAIQGLNQKLTEQDRKLEQREQELEKAVEEKDAKLSALERRLEALEKLVAHQALAQNAAAQ